MASSQPLPDTLAEDLNEIKTYLKTQDHLCASTIQAFLVRYDVLGKAALIRLSSALFNDSDLLEALLDNWEGLLDPVTFVKFIYSFCLIQDVSITYNLFLESGGSTELLRAMDTDVKSKELIFYGARCLAVLSANPGLRSSLSEGDGISLLVDCLHYHKKDPMTSVVLLLLLANLTYKNAVSKKAFADSNGITITTSIITANHNSSSVLLGCLHVLRHVTANDRDVKLAESKHRTHILKETISALKSHTQNEPLLIHGLWTILNLISCSVANKLRFLGEHGIALLDEISVDQERNDIIMALVCTILHQMLKLQKVRTELFNRETSIPMLGRVLRTFTEPKPLFAASKALHVFALHTGARSTIGHDLSEVILSVIRTPVHFPRLHAVLGKLVLRLCLDPEIKANMQSLRAVSAIQQGKDYNTDQHATLRFFIAAEEFLQSPEGSPLPPRPDPNDLLLMEHLHSEPRATSFQPGSNSGSSNSSDSRTSRSSDMMDDGPTIDVEALLGAGMTGELRRRSNSNASSGSSSSDDSSSTTSSSSDSNDATAGGSSDDDDITAELKREEAEKQAEMHSSVQTEAATASAEAKQETVEDLDEPYELTPPSISVIDTTGKVISTPPKSPSDESSASQPGSQAKPDGVVLSSENIEDDLEMAALLKDIEITASSPNPSPRKATASHSPTNGTLGTSSSIHRRRASRDRDSSVSLDDSLQGLDAELEKLRSEDFGGTRTLDDFDSEFNWSENDTSNVSVAASDPDTVLARIEAIERMTEELDAFSTVRKTKAGSDAPSPIATSPNSTEATLSALDDAISSLESTPTQETPTAAENPSDSSSSSDESLTSNPEADSAKPSEDTEETVLESHSTSTDSSPRINENGSTSIVQIDDSKGLASFALEPEPVKEADSTALQHLPLDTVEPLVESETRESVLGLPTVWSPPVPSRVEVVEEPKQSVFHEEPKEQLVEEPKEVPQEPQDPQKVIPVSTGTEAEPTPVPSKSKTKPPPSKDRRNPKYSTEPPPVAVQKPVKSTSSAKMILVAIVSAVLVLALAVAATYVL